MTPKPLHVQVAEALGCKPRRFHAAAAEAVWLCDCPGAVHGQRPDSLSDEFGRDSTIPRYDLDWSATGPLIEKYRIDLINPHKWIARKFVPPADRYADVEVLSGEARAPLDAICYLLLALHQAGKLKDAV